MRLKNGLMLGGVKSPNIFVYKGGGLIMKILETNIDGALVQLSPQDILILRSAMTKESSIRSRRYERINPTSPDEMLVLASEKVTAHKMKVEVLSLIQTYKVWGVI